MRTTPYAHPVPGAAEIMGIKTSKLYELIAEQQIKAKKIGSRTVILDESIREYLAGLPDAQITYSRR